jgi:hypothetical protein
MDGRHFAAKAAHFSVANKLPYDLSAGLPFSWQFV